MATRRISAGVYEVNGKRVNANSATEAERKAGSSSSKRGDGGKAASSTNETGAKQIKLDRAEKTVKKNVEGGQNLANLLGLTKPLSRISTEIPEDQKAFIEAIKSLSDPSSEAFVGKRSGEEKAALENLRGLMDSSKEQTPEETRALGALEDLMGRAGTRSEAMSGLLSRLEGDSRTRGERSAETADILSQLRGRVATAGNRSQDMQDTLSLMKQGLAGLSAPENQALREQGQREVDRKYQLAVEDLQNTARRSGMGSAARAGMRNARRDAMGAQADLEQKNLLANIDVQDRRRKDYANTLGNQEQMEFDRASGALRDYGAGVGDAESRENQRYADALSLFSNQLRGVESDEFGQRSDAARNFASGVSDFTNSRWSRMNNASANYANTVNQLGQNERERVRGAMGDYGNALEGRNSYFMDATQTNLGQERTDRAAEVQGALGLAGLSETERARKRALRQNKRRGGDGRNSGMAQGAPQQGQYGGFNSQADQEYYNAIASAYNQPTL